MGIGTFSEGPTVLVFGASGVLGSAVVKAFRQNSWRVIGTGYRHSPQTDLFFQFDATQKNEIHRFEDWIRTNLSQIDVAVHCIGIARDASLPNIKLVDWQDVLNTNLKSAYLLAQMLIKKWISQKQGHLIFVGSWAGVAGRHGQASYAAAKAGLIGLTQSLAREYASRNIRANCIIPGVFPSSMTQNLSHEKLQRLWEGSACARFADLDETSRFIAHIATMRGVTGQIFHLDGRIPPVLS